MRRFIVLLIAFLFVPVIGTFAQEEGSQENEIFFLQWLKPHNDNIEAFEEAIKEHNQKFHSEDTVTVFYEITGDNYGHYELVQGPYTWTEWENRDLPEGHKEHWINTVMPLVEHEAEPSAWKRLPKYELINLEESSRKSIITILTIKQGEYDRFMRALEKWHEANKAADNFDGSYNVFSRQLGGVYQVGILSYMENGWADLDDENNFRKRFEEKHGKSAWDLWTDDVQKAIKSEDVVSRVHLPGLSTGSGDN